MMNRRQPGEFLKLNPDSVWHRSHVLYEPLTELSFLHFEVDSDCRSNEKLLFVLVR